MTPTPNPCIGLDYGYLLIDVLNFGESWPETVESIPCIPAGLANVEALVPRLVDVATLSPSELEQMVEIFGQQATGEYPFAICAWLECDIEIEALAERIAFFLCGRGPEDSQIIWRYFDPRVFPIAMSLFSQEQRDALLGPIKNWRFAWCGNWWLVEHDAIHEPVILDQDIGWPTEQQWPSVQRSRVINNVLKLLGTNAHLTHEQCMRYLAMSIVNLNDCIGTFHLADENDQTEFVYLCTTFGLAYRRHAKLAAGWSALKEGAISWTDLRLQLNANDFAKIKPMLDLK
jgi:hypothetical protein